MGRKDHGKEQELIARVFEEHGAMIFNFAMRLSGNQAVAEDLMSETIIQSVSALGRLRDSALERTFLRRITLNLYRRTARRRTWTISADLPSAPFEREAVLAIEGAYVKLPQKLQEAFVLVKAEGLTAREAAAVLRIPQGTVQARVHEAVRLIRLELGVEVGARGEYVEVSL